MAAFEGRGFEIVRAGEDAFTASFCVGESTIEGQSKGTPVVIGVSISKSSGTIKAGLFIAPSL